MIIQKYSHSDMGVQDYTTEISNLMLIVKQVCDT